MTKEQLLADIPLDLAVRNRATPNTQADGENARLEDCPGENRIRLFFPGKPDVQVRSRLKSAGFRWSPTIGCWQAYRNSSTIQTAKREAGIAKADWRENLWSGFVAEIERLATQCGKAPEVVYGLWKEYSKDCEHWDQSPVLFEFQEWYKEQLKPIAA